MFRCGKTSFSVDHPGDAVGSPIVSSAAEGSGPRWAASQPAPGDPVLSNNFQRICPSKEGSLCNSGVGARGGGSLLRKNSLSDRVHLFLSYPCSNNLHQNTTT